MATRSTIAMEFADGTVKQIYAHWDGYLAGNGNTLLQHYKTPADVAELLALGDLSSLDENIDSTVFYGRDKGETNTAARRYDSFDEYRLTGESESYNYIMREGVWYVDRGPRGAFIPLVDAFREEERI